MPPSEFKETAEDLNTSDSVQVDGIEYDAHWAHDTRRLLDENARLNAELESLRVHNGVLVTEIYHQAARADAFREERDALVLQHQTDLAARRTAKEHLRRDVVETDEERERLAAELDRVIREAAADKAKAEELARENRVLRLEPSNARFDEVVAEKNQAIDTWYEAAKERDELACKVEAVRDVITPKNPDWKPLTERHPEYFTPVSPEEAARKEGWRQGEESLTQRIKAALDGPTAAPEMPRPPAEETQVCTGCGGKDFATWTAPGGWTMLVCRECSTPLGWPNPEITLPAAQERAGDADTSPAGSGRGAGVTEAPGAAQDGEEA